MGTKAKTVAEVIAGAIQLFTRSNNGVPLHEPKWNNHSLQIGDKYCVLGALSKVAVGRTCYPNDVKATKEYKEAADLVASCVPEGYKVKTGRGIPHWNDSLSERTGFSSVKKVLCKALNKALKQEEGKRR